MKIKNSTITSSLWWPQSWPQKVLFYSLMLSLASVYMPGVDEGYFYPLATLFTHQPRAAQTVAQCGSVWLATCLVWLLFYTGKTLLIQSLSACLQQLRWITNFTRASISWTAELVMLGAESSCHVLFLKSKFIFQTWCKYKLHTENGQS